MSKGMLFWVVFIVALLFGMYADYVPGHPYPMRRAGWVFLLFVLIGILGWQVFGAVVK